MKKSLMFVVVVVGGLAAGGALVGPKKPTPALGPADLAAIDSSREGSYRATFIAYQGDCSDGALLLLDSVEKPKQKKGARVVMPTALAQKYDARLTRWTETHPTVTVKLAPGKNGGPMTVVSLDGF